MVSRLDYIPTKESGYKLKNISCTENATVTWDDEEWGPNIRNLTSVNTVCTIEFYSIEAVLDSWLKIVGLKFSDYGSLNNILINETACSKLIFSEEAIEFMCICIRTIRI